ncbi:ATP-binding protein [Actinomadura gamaensis]|uniref:ATP-binding protein n=1 Tax=Actinomadura gamaensis TaxID=1763541 RepID=A0ABV9U6Z3_9ACTN
MDYEIAAPDPAGMVASLSSLGYSLEAAVADLVDNSIGAQARQIEVEFTWEGENSWIAVVDDGQGMGRDELVTAMTPAARGPAAERSTLDLGRFGMGLKTASFSQARQLTVATASPNGRWHTRTWDLDMVERTGEWRLLVGCDDATRAIVEGLRGSRPHGTVVLWRRLNGYDSDEFDGDRTAQQQFYDEAGRVESHLGMVFARFLNEVALSVQGVKVQPWDPFLRRHRSVQLLPVEGLPLSGALVRVEGFVLPHAQKLSPAEHREAGGPTGWLNQQGFYVYRRNRLIVAGDWLGLRGMRKEEKYSLARICVDIPAELDSEWSVDVRKSKIVPPVPLRRHLARIAHRTREKASEVLRHRGQIAAREHGAPHVYAWRVERRDGRIVCRINRQHPLVQEILRSGSNGAVRALLSLLEETVPVEALRVMHDTDAADDPQPFKDLPSETEEMVARHIYEALVSRGSSPSEASRKLVGMHPFNQLEGFWHQ